MLYQQILRSDDSISADLVGVESIRFIAYRVNSEVDDGDASLGYVRRRRAGGEG